MIKRNIFKCESKKILKQVQYGGYPTGQASKSIQYDRWHRTSFSLGRSMIEMLGVLAIIGVLSIGGLYAYRQAMNRYKTNEIKDFIQRVRFVAQEICPNDAKNCDYFLKPILERKESICGLLGSDCQTSLSKPEYASLPTLPESAWYIYLIADDKNNQYRLMLQYLPAEICVNLATSFPGQTTYYVKIATGWKPIYKNKDQNFTPEDIKKAKETCLDPTYTKEVAFVFELY